MSVHRGKYGSANDLSSWLTREADLVFPAREGSLQYPAPAAPPTNGNGNGHSSDPPADESDASPPSAERSSEPA